MNIHIHRGQNQIGGSVIEISTESARIFLDIGIELDEGKNINIPYYINAFCAIIVMYIKTIFNKRIDSVRCTY